MRRNLYKLVIGAVMILAALAIWAMSHSKDIEARHAETLSELATDSAIASSNDAVPDE